VGIVCILGEFMCNILGVGVGFLNIVHVTSCVIWSMS